MCFCFHLSVSGSFDSVQWKACLHRLDLGLYPHLKELSRVESEPVLTPKGKICMNGVRTCGNSKGENLHEWSQNLW